MRHLEIYSFAGAAGKVIRQDLRFLPMFRLVFTTDIRMNRLTHTTLPTSYIYSRPVTLTIPNKEKRIRKIL